MKRFLVLLLLCAGLVACERGPDKTALQEQVAKQLETEFQPGLFRIETFVRMGSAPFTDSESGESRLLLYFRTRLVFETDHDFSAWQGLSVASLAGVLGAAQEGISGIDLGGNLKGDVLEIYGTATFRKAADGWQYLPYKPEAVAQAPPLDEFGNPTSGESLLQKWLGLFGTEVDISDPGIQRIAEEELENAIRNVNLRVDQREGIFTLVTGERGGTYYEIGAAVSKEVRAPGVTIRHFETQGSVENLRLVAARHADIGFVQNDIAAMAYKGEGPFSGRAPMTDLRALRSLYPEPVQIVTLADSELETAADLAGRRLEIGLPKSGSRINSLLVLTLLGFAESDFAELREEGVAEAAEALKRGEIDAFITTAAAPVREIQDLAATHPVRLLPLDAVTIDTIESAYDYYEEFVIPPWTYVGQSHPARTIAVTALAVTHQSLPDERVLKLLEATRDNAARVAQRNFQGYYLLQQSADIGISIPQHPAAQRFYSVSGE